MKALVYLGPGKKAWAEVPDPTITRPTDAIVRIDATTICGTDLHILKGETCRRWRRGACWAAGMGTVTAVGAAVSTLKVGDRVILSCIKSCGRCSFCKQGLFSHCQGDEGAVGLGYQVLVTSSTAPWPSRCGCRLARDVTLHGAARRRRRAGRAAQRHSSHRV